jgi:hypothetical protein
VRQRKLSGRDGYWGVFRSTYLLNPLP